MGRRISQFSQLMWKNFLLQIRTWIGMIFEILVPIGCVSALLVYRSRNLPSNLCFQTSREDIGNMYGDEDLAYYPHNNIINALMTNVSMTLNHPLSRKTFSTEQEMVTEVIEASANYSGAIIFNVADDATELPQVMRYSIRFPQSDADSNTWHTDINYSPTVDKDPRNYRSYKRGFLALQHAVDQEILFRQTESYDPSNLKSAQSVMTYVQKFPYPAYTKDVFYSRSELLLPLLLAMSFIFSSAAITGELTLEKECRMKECMKMMGLSNWMHWLAWFTKYIIYLFIHILVVLLMVKVGNIFPNSNGFLLFVFLLLWMISSITWSFLISCFFSRAPLALIFAMVLWLFNYLPMFFLDYDSTSSGEKTAACLLSNTCMGIGVLVLARFESIGVGLQFSNAGDSPLRGDTFSMATVFGMLILDAVIYMLLTIYIEAVFPGKYGIPRPFYFPFQRSYWCGEQRRKVHVADEDDYSQVRENQSQTSTQEENNESEPANVEVGIKISNLTKIYKSAAGNKTAVDNLSVSMLKGQITALLGHNGAGKTTTMSILTGLFPPSSGTALVNGHSILDDMDGVRQSLGLCPQHNILFGRLTVKEHLKLFIRLKGKFGRDSDDEVDQMIKDLQLEDKANTRTSNLSGGMKRKLSCALALIGGSEIVILDEPTSGMDPYARRATWDLLLKYKTGRTMVLTTHFMDEADLLGDRIAIMADGQIRASGTPLFLKNRFGVGYHLTMVQTERVDVDRLDNLIKIHVPKASLRSQVGTEIDYILPTENRTAFKDLFTKLETDRRQLGIDSFGVSVTTMEEVFMKVGKMVERGDKGLMRQTSRIGPPSVTYTNHAMCTQQDLGADEPHVKINVSRVNSVQIEMLSGFALKLIQFKAMFIKRALCTLRDKKMFVTQLILPNIFVIAALTILVVTSPAAPTDGPRLLDLKSISDEATGGSANVFYADLRDSRSEDYNLFKYLESHLRNLCVTPDNVSAIVENMATDNEDDLIYGMERTSNIQCCSYTNLILNQHCFSFLHENQGRICENIGTFGYHECNDCLNPSLYWNQCLDMDDLTTLNSSRYYFSEHILNISDAQDFFYDNVAGFTLTGDESTPDLYVWYSDKGYHVSAEGLNAASNILLKYFTNDSFSIETTNYPLPSTADSEDFESSGDPSTDLAFVIIMLFGLAFLSGSNVLFIISEKEIRAKHLQYVSGLDVVTYWLSNYCWDVVSYLVNWVIFIILFAAFNTDAYGGSNLGSIVLLLLLYGLAAIPFVYLISIPFKSSLFAYGVTTFVLSLLALGTFALVDLLNLSEKNDAAQVADGFFKLLPTHCTAKALRRLSDNERDRARCESFLGNSEDCTINNLAWETPGIGVNCVYLGLEAVMYLLMTILIEMACEFITWGSRHIPLSEMPLDEDVKAEQEMVQDLAPKDGTYAVVMNSLTKVYRGKQDPAVNHLSLAIPKGECFGLLGVNGAGKTTTFGMLTGDIKMSAGTAYMHGFNIQTEKYKVLQRIGYCPQFDALLELLSGREILTMYARLRGIPEWQISSIVDNTIAHLNLANWQNKLCGTYSGGNKRKLSTAIALVGNPPIVFLDEPTSGMDPKARRYLWDALSSIMEGGRSIILTSHSMEECEALCTRLAIMVNGQFKCLGSTQHLKNRFGAGYSMTVKASSVELVEPIKAFIAKTFPASLMLEEHDQMIHYQVNSEETNWASIFGSLEDNRERLNIVDYNVSQTSLEQVFINFAKEQHADLRCFPSEES